jgi:hypothetical protein
VLFAVVAALTIAAMAAPADAQSSKAAWRFQELVALGSLGALRVGRCRDRRDGESCYDCKKHSLGSLHFESSVPFQDLVSQVTCVNRIVMNGAARTDVTSLRRVERLVPNGRRSTVGCMAR